VAALGPAFPYDELHLCVEHAGALSGRAGRRSRRVHERALRFIRELAEQPDTAKEISLPTTPVRTLVPC
jgi:hypothetical protein